MMRLAPHLNHLPPTPAAPPALTALLLTLLLTLTACGGATAEEKRALGLRAHTLSMRDLGATYQPFEGSALDLFSASPRVKALTARPPELITHHTYGAPPLDAALRRGAALCAEFAFAEHAAVVFEREGASTLGGGTLTPEAVSARLESARAERPEAVERLRLAYLAARLAVHTLEEAVSRAEASAQELARLTADGVEGLLPPAARGALARDASASAERLISLLQRIPSAAPALAVRLGAQRDALTALAQVF